MRPSSWMKAVLVAIAVATVPLAARAQLVSNTAGDDWTLPAGTARADYSGLYWISQSNAATLSAGHTQPRYAVNIPVTWSTVNPSQGVYDWSSVDAIVNAVHAMGPGAGFGLWPWYGSQSEIPSWVQSRYSLVFGSNGRDWPWSPGDQWEQAVRPFIQAMATRYGSDPQLVYVDMRVPFDQYGEFTLPTSDATQASAIETWQDSFVDDYTTAFAGHEHKLVNMISGAGAFYVDPVWKTTFEGMIGYSYGKGTGERDGFPTETKIWHAGFGHVVTPAGYLTFDETHPPFVDGAFYGSENTEFDPTSSRFGPAADTPYRYRLAVLWNLLTRRNWLVLALYDTAGYSDFAHWAEIELGQRAATAPDAWSWPKSSGYGNFYIDSLSPTTVKNFERWLYQRDETPDGTTQPAVQEPDGMFGRGGIEAGSEYGARRTDHASGNHEMYFSVDREFLSAGTHPVWIKVTYLDDCTSGAWHPEYSTATSADFLGASVPYTGSGGWRTATFQVDDLDLSGSFAGGTDFRLVDSGGCDLTVDFVRMVKQPQAACVSGDTRACGVGACAGQEQCTSGAWSSCSGAAPSTEICNNGIDDDCDGATDSEDTDCAGLHSELASTPPSIDGDLSEFASAPPTIFSKYATSDNTVTVRSMWDQNDLYLGFDVVDANVEAVATTRDGNEWSNDSVEIFLDTRHDAGPKMLTDDYHFIVDVNGGIYDARGNGVSGANGDPSWNSGIVAATTTTASGYAVEIAIPWSDIGTTPSAGKVLGALLVNNDLDNGNLVYFSDYGPTPWAVPDSWGPLTLVGAAATDGGVADGGGGDGGAGDAGTADGGAVTDAGSTSNDGGSPGADAGGGGSNDAGGGLNGTGTGCGCNATSGGAPLAALMLLALLFLRRRRPIPSSDTAGRSSTRV